MSAVRGYAGFWMGERGEGSWVMGDIVGLAPGLGYIFLCSFIINWIEKNSICALLQLTHTQVEK